MKANRKISSEDTPAIIPVAKPSLTSAEFANVRRVMESGWVTQGPEVHRFEQEFAEAVGAEHACAVSSATSALHLSLLVAGVGPADEVITASHSFIATANSIRYCGAIPVFVDIEPQTFNLDPHLVEAAITSKTKAILCVHQMGMPADLKKLSTVAKRNGLALIEDAACAIGSEIQWSKQWKRIGAPIGDIACFSFHPRKVITTGDGGMITTSNANWDTRFRLLRQHGMSVSDLSRHKSTKPVFESYPVLGFNYRMTDIQAAVGRAQLSKLPEIVSRRRELAEGYRRGFENIAQVTCPGEPQWARSNWQSYCVRIQSRLSTERLMEALLKQGISTRRAIMCSHLEPCYSEKSQPARWGKLIQSENATANGLILPLFHDMTDREQERVIATLSDLVQSS